VTEQEYDRIMNELKAKSDGSLARSTMKGAMTGATVAAGIAALDTAADINDREAKARYYGALSAGVPKFFAGLWAYPGPFITVILVVGFLIVGAVLWVFTHLAWGAFFLTGHQMMPLDPDPYFRQHVNYSIDQLYDTPYDGPDTENTHLTATLTNTTPYDIKEFQIECKINYPDEAEGPRSITLNGGEVPAHQSRTYSVTDEKEGYGQPGSHTCTLLNVEAKQQRTFLPVGWDH
jgi:hypothetical protein